MRYKDFNCECEDIINERENHRYSSVSVMKLIASTVMMNGRCYNVSLPIEGSWFRFSNRVISIFWLLCSSFYATLVSKFETVLMTSPFRGQWCVFSHLRTAKRVLRRLQLRGFWLKWWTEHFAHEIDVKMAYHSTITRILNWVLREVMRDTR